MIASFIKFPVNLVIEHKRGSRTKEKVVISMYKGWKNLTDSIPVDNSTHYAMLTGAKNNITVLDISKHDSIFVDMDDLKMFNVSTPSGGTHFYFQYEEKLQSIYSLLPGVSVINGSGCVFFGQDYKILNNKPIIKMPQVLFNILYDQQINRPEEVIDQRIYGLLNILPYKWFNEHEVTMQLIHVLRNENVANAERSFSTLKRLLAERSDHYHEKISTQYYNSHMTYKQKRFGVCALSKTIKSEYPTQYEEWLRKWHPKKGSKIAIKNVTPQSKMVYKPGASIKLSDLKASYNGQLTAAILLQMNKEFTISRKSICTSRLNRHKVGCCREYKRDARTRCQFVDNIDLK